MFKLVLRLLSLFSPHLLLQLSVSIFWLGLNFLGFLGPTLLALIRFLQHILAMWLGSLICLLLLLTMWYTIPMRLLHSLHIRILSRVLLVIIVWFLVWGSAADSVLLRGKALRYWLMLSWLALVLVEGLEPIVAISGSSMAVHVEGISTNAEWLLVSTLQRLLIVDYMHWQRLVGKPSHRLISAILLIHLLAWLLIIKLLT